MNNCELTCNSAPSQGTHMVLIKNATIWTGEDNGHELLSGDILLANGIIKSVGEILDPKAIPAWIPDDATIDIHQAHGAFVTPGIFDMVRFFLPPFSSAPQCSSQYFCTTAQPHRSRPSTRPLGRVRHQLGREADPALPALARRNQHARPLLQAFRLRRSHLISHPARISEQHRWSGVRDQAAPDKGEDARQPRARDAVPYPHSQQDSVAS